MRKMRKNIYKDSRSKKFVAPHLLSSSFTRVSRISIENFFFSFSFCFFFTQAHWCFFHLRWKDEDTVSTEKERKGKFHGEVNNIIYRWIKWISILESLMKLLYLLTEWVSLLLLQFKLILSLTQAKFGYGQLRLTYEWFSASTFTNNLKFMININQFNQISC